MSLQLILISLRFYPLVLLRFATTPSPTRDSLSHDSSKTLPFCHSCHSAIPSIIPPSHMPFRHSCHSAILPFLCHSAIPPFRHSCHSAIRSFRHSRHSAIMPFCHSYAIPPFCHSTILAIPPFDHSDSTRRVANDTNSHMRVQTYKFVCDRSIIRFRAYDLVSPTRLSIVGLLWRILFCPTMGSHHIAVRPWYVQTENSPRVLPWALRPSTLKGCVGTLQNGYIRNIPLPRVVPRIQSASHVTNHGTDPDTCYSQVPRVPTCSNLNRLHQGLGGKRPLPLFPCWLM